MQQKIIFKNRCYSR